MTPSTRPSSSTTTTSFEPPQRPPSPTAIGTAAGVDGAFAVAWIVRHAPPVASDNLSGASRDAVDKLRLDDTPTPRSRVARMNEAAASIGVGRSASESPCKSSALSASPPPRQRTPWTRCGQRGDITASHCGVEARTGISGRVPDRESPSAERTGSLLYFRSPANLDQISSGSGLSRAVLARVVAGLQCFITHWPVGEFFVPAE